MTALAPPTPHRYKPLAGIGVSYKQQLAYKMKRQEQYLKLRHCRRIKTDVLVCVCVCDCAPVGGVGACQ